MNKLEFDVPSSVKLVTTEGHPVEGVRYVPYNDSGRAVTFPVKGSVYEKSKKGYKFSIFDMAGKAVHAGGVEYILSAKSMGRLWSWISTNDLPVDIRHFTLWGAATEHMKKFELEERLKAKEIFQ